MLVALSIMGLFTRKKSSFTNTNISLGNTRPVYLKPSKKELKEIAGAGRISHQPHGVKPKVRSRTKRYTREAIALVSDFQQLNPTSINEFSEGFGSYSSKSHLYRNLGL